MKIYRYMKSLDLKREYYIQLSLRIAAAALGVAAAFYFACPLASFGAISFCVFWYYYHFMTEKDLYKLRSEYKRLDLSCREALEKCEAEMCLISMENADAKKVWHIAFLFCVLPFLFSKYPVLSLILCIPAVIAPLICLWYLFRREKELSQ